MPILIMTTEPETGYSEPSLMHYTVRKLHDELHITQAELASAQSRIAELEAKQPEAGSGDKGEISDGYHTFNELYDHRCTLFLALMKAHPTISWFSTKHDDGSKWDGWFIAGIKAPTGDVTYHLPARMWSLACETGAAVLERGIRWDGHTPVQVVERIQAWVSLKPTEPSPAPNNS